MMNARLSRTVLLVAATVVAAALAAIDACAAAWEPEAADFVLISGPASPRVAFAARRSADILLVALDISTFPPDAAASASLGLAAAGKVVVSEKDVVAAAARGKGSVRYLFAIPAAKLVEQKDDWVKLRMAVAVAWPGGPLGKDRQREQFRQAGFAAHAGLSGDPADWLPLDMDEYEAMVADRRNAIRIGFAQPMDGKATIVINDETGGRVRNLIAGQPMPKGKHELTWDGLDEDGNVVKPGTYAWRSISHPGITPEYLFSFCNDGQPPWRTGSGIDMWGPDHSCLTEATAGAEWTFLAGSCAESGYAIVAVDAAGTKRMHYNPVHGTGLGKVCLASSGKFLYAAHDGLAWGERLDTSRKDWKGEYKLTITRFDVPSGRVVDFPGNARQAGGRFVTVATVEFGPGSARPEWSGLNLAGMAVLGDLLYVGCRASGSIIVLDAGTCDRVGEIRLPSPGPMAASAGAASAKAGLLAVSGTSVVAIDPAAPAAAPRTVIAEGVVAPVGLAVDAAGSIYVSDSKSNTVRVFDSAGKELRQIGQPGGTYEGAYVPERLLNPRGIAVSSNGWLWVTENRGNPKRVTAWNLATGRLAKAKFGPTAYGASGAGFDSADFTRWIGQGAAWQLDFKLRSAVPTSILSKAGGHVGGAYGSSSFDFVRQDGRVFVIGGGPITTISEFRRDGSLRDLAFVASTHRLSFACGWDPPAAFVEAFNAAYPDRKGKHSDKGPGVLWVDRNADGLCQADEFSFSTASENFAGAYWGHHQRNLTIRVPATVKGRRVLVVLKPKGYLPGGAPDYPPLNDACAAGVPIALGSNEIETGVDRFGNLICNSDPRMTCFSPEGRLLWTYPNRWTNVHGSHNAPLPEIGMMQGALYFLGMAPLDDAADVFVMNGNHGRFFAITSDGFYLDEMFKDVRMGAVTDAYLIGGECFGGFFSKSEKDGAYYLQSGHTDYRIFRVNGLKEARRASGRITVTPAQASAAESSLTRTAAETALPKQAKALSMAKPPAIDAKDEDWTGADVTLQWDKSGRFPVKVRCGWDDTCLYLFYAVEDESPWVNNGKDKTLLFKTGDSVDLQLGTDAAANPNRRGPAPGDLRLLIAPFDGKPLAVLYRHRVPGTKEPVAFVSPWRSEKVDSVTFLDNARIAVAKDNGRYRLEAAIPLADIGLARPAGNAERTDVRSVLKADFGVLYGDRDGAITLLRSYWSNQATSLVNDVPGEIMLFPNLWGTVEFERK